MNDFYGNIERRQAVYKLRLVRAMNNLAEWPSQETDL